MVNVIPVLCKHFRVFNIINGLYFYPKSLKWTSVATTFVVMKGLKIN